MPSEVRGSLFKSLTRQDKRMRGDLLKVCMDTASLGKRTLDIVVQNWKSDVKYGLDARATPNRIAAMILLAGQDAAIFTYVDQGTGRHGPRGQAYIIAPKGDKPLRFQSGYAPKTRPVGKFGAASGSFGDWVSTYQVIHPGIKAREFTDETLRTLSRIFYKDVENAITHKK